MADIGNQFVSEPETSWKQGERELI